MTDQVSHPYKTTGQISVGDYICIYARCFKSRGSFIVTAATGVVILTRIALCGLSQVHASPSIVNLNFTFL
jgi:hypothetical protein